MAVTQKVDHDGREMYATADGPITIDDIRKHLAVEHRDKGLAYRELIEASGATVEFSPSDVRETVALLRGYGRKGALGPTAIIVGNDCAYGMMRMLSILLEDVCELQPFRTRLDAKRWLEKALVHEQSSAPS